jgi:UDP-N-acetylmuramyl pentapeptide phosphotransferase/UDP-N-acetylglucosamine-1-phosphate transferase
MEFVNELITEYIPIWILALISTILAFGITFLSIPPIVKIAKAKGLYDLPNGRTSHFQATPYLGGVAVFTSIILTSVLIGGITFSQELMYIIAGLIILLFVGLKDDMLIINPKKKLLGQLTAAGIIVVLGDIRIDNFHGVLGFYDIPYIASILFTVFVFIVIVNGINLIDGIDGLASSISILISMTLGYWFFKAEVIPYAILCFTMVGSLSAFFYFNVFGKKNKIFLGDAGSLIVGMSIAVFTIQFLEKQAGISGPDSVSSAPAVAFGILIIPLFDSLRVFSLRIMQGRSPFSADRQHLHHILLDLGFSHLHATFILFTVNLFFIFLAMALNYPISSNIVLILMQIILATGLSMIATRILRRKREKNIHGKQSLAKEIELISRSASEEEFNEGKKKSSKGKKIEILKILNA